MRFKQEKAKQQYSGSFCPTITGFPGKYVSLETNTNTLMHPQSHQLFKMYTNPNENCICEAKIRL